MLLLIKKTLHIQTTIFKFCIYLLSLTCMGKSKDNLQDSVLSFYQVDPGNRTLVIRLSSRWQAISTALCLHFLKKIAVYDWKTSIIFLSFKKGGFCYSICIFAFTEHIFGVYFYFCVKFRNSVAKVISRWLLYQMEYLGCMKPLYSALCLSVIVGASVHFRNQDSKDVFHVYSEISVRYAAVLLQELSMC